jgi:hypothetical protein
MIRGCSAVKWSAFTLKRAVKNDLPGLARLQTFSWLRDESSAFESEWSTPSSPGSCARGPASRFRRSRGRPRVEK